VHAELVAAGARRHRQAHRRLVVLVERDAAAAAAVAAQAAGAHHLAARGLIAEGRARIAMQDFGQGERRLGEAEAILAQHPDGGLLADVMLAYSSLALQLGRHTLMRDYAQRGLDAIGPGGAAVVRSRLLEPGDIASPQRPQRRSPRSTYSGFVPVTRSSRPAAPRSRCAWRYVTSSMSRGCSPSNNSSPYIMRPA